jgi:arylsulfatase A-like enzyme
VYKIVKYYKKIKMHTLFKKLGSLLTAAVMLIGLLIMGFSFNVYAQRNPYPQYRPGYRTHLDFDTARNTPNIIIILTDDMGYSDLSCDGGRYSTPNIDRLAKEGTLFTHYYSAAPICSPARVSLLTGMEPSKWNITTFEQTTQGNKAADQAPYLNPIAPSLARTLKDVGYVTGHFGKWHMGGGRDVYFAPPFSAYGFDEHSSTYESPDPDPLLTATNWIWSPKDSIKRWERTAYFVDKTLDFLKRHKGKPCFVDLWPDDMHTPWVPNKEAQDQFPKGANSEANFKLVLKEYDRQIGRLLGGLRKLGIANNTIVIFTSDNGPLPTFDGRRSGGKRGSKLSLYEGGTNLPFIVRWPGHVAAGKVDTTSVISSLDIFPTLASIVGISMPTRFSFDGIDRKEVWLDHPSSERGKTMYWDYGSHGKESAFHYPRGRDHSPNLAIRQGQWKLLINYDGSGMELYNIVRDPKETNNLVGIHKDIAERLEKQLILWRNNQPKLKDDRYRR